MREYSTRRSRVYYRSWKTRASSISVFSRNSKGLQYFTIKSRVTVLKEQRALDCVLTAKRKQWESESDLQISSRSRRSVY